MTRHTVLFVDDEPSILNSLQRLFYREPVEVLTAANGEEGLQKMETTEVALVISDYKMPGMSGADFLSLVREKYPVTIRILLTGHADKKVAIETINKGEIYRLLTIPFDNEEILLTVRQALEQYESSAPLYQELKRRAEELTKQHNKEMALAAVGREEDKTGVISRRFFLDAAYDVSCVTCAYCGRKFPVQETYAVHPGHIKSLSHLTWAELSIRRIDDEKGCFCRQHASWAREHSLDIHHCSSLIDQIANAISDHVNHGNPTYLSQREETVSEDELLARFQSKGKYSNHR